MKIAAAIVIASAAIASAQQPAPANTEVFLAQLTLTPRPMISGPLTNISNSPGYDSQPSFLPDGSGVLFSSQRVGTQYDIYKYDFASQKVVQVTKTPENENSPLATPDGKTFSVVQSEADRSQRLWRFNMDGMNPQLVLADLKLVGYHVWVDATHLLLYVLPTPGSGQPNTLQYADTQTGKADVIDTRVGRSLLMRPGTGTVSYISQPQGSHAVVKEFDPKTRETRTVVETADAMSQDAAWLPNGMLLMSIGSKILGWMPPRPGAPDAGWQDVADFTSAGIARITRMAVAPMGPGAPNMPARFALVAEPVAK